MKEDIFLSIIVPVYNTEQYLAKCIGSILQANIPQMEIILVDDGSTDNSLTLCQTYAAQYDCIKVLVQENAGPSAARNRGLRQARGTYVAFFDSDDHVQPDVFLQSIRVCLCQSFSPDVLVSDFLCVGADDRIFNVARQIKETAHPIFDRNYLMHFLRSQGCYWNVWRCVFRREFLLSHDSFFCEGYHCAEDLEFMTRVLTEAEDICFYHAPYYRYVVAYGNTLSRRYTIERIRHFLTMLSKSIAYLECNRTRLCAGRMVDKLAFEYVVNLALYYDIKRSDRAVAGKLFYQSAELLTHSNSWKYRFFYRFIRFFGIKAAASVLYVLKQGRRLLRTAKRKQRRKDGGL